MIVMVLEMLAHRAPPSSIAPIILTVLHICMPNQRIVKALPSENWIRQCRTLLVYITKTLAAMKLGFAKEYKQLFMDGTNHRQTPIQNAIVRYLGDNGYETVSVDTAIIAKDETAECLSGCIEHTFNRCGDLLESWRSVVERMYPNKPDILAGIPSHGDVTLVKLGKGGTIITDGCSTACKHRQLLKTRILELARELGIPDCEINIFEGDCWQHMRNVWFGAIIKHLSGWLEKRLVFDLEKIPFIYRVITSIDNLLQCIEKEVAKTANYAKGHGVFFDHYMKTFHPGVYLFRWRGHEVLVQGRGSRQKSVDRNLGTLQICVKNTNVP